MIFARKVDMLNEKQNGKQQKVKDSKVIAEGSGDKSWWEKKDLESQRWFLYTALAVLAITAVYVTPDKYSAYRFIVGGWIVLLGLHLVIWPFFTEKTSVVTKIVITGFILFFIVAVILPNATQKEVATVKEKIASFDKDYGKTSVSQATQQGGTPASIVAVREKPSDWIRFAEHKTTAYRCTGDGMIYVRHNKTGPEGIGPFPCTPNGISRDLNLLQNGERVEQLEYLEVRFQSNGEPFLVNFLECPTNTSCRMRMS